MGMKTTDVVCFKLPLFQITEFHAFKAFLPLFSEAHDLFFKWIFKRLTDQNVCERDFQPKMLLFFHGSYQKHTENTMEAVSGLCIHTVSNKPPRIPSQQAGGACCSPPTQKPSCSSISALLNCQPQNPKYCSSTTTKGF